MADDSVTRLREALDAVQNFRGDLDSDDFNDVQARLRFRAVAAATYLLDEIERLRAEAEKLRTVMVAAAEEIDAHWQAHCDADGYGPVNLQRRLEEGIPSEYGYTAGAFAKLKAETEALRAALAAQQAPQAEPVAWAYVPSDVWRETIITQDPEQAAEARRLGRVVTPLYAAPAAPAGWQLVPVEPTREMMHAAFAVPLDEADWLSKRYKTMLAAAPTHTGDAQ